MMKASRPQNLAWLRDKSDEVSKVVHNYAESETVNKSLKNGLSKFSATLSAVSDYRDAEVRRLETKVVSELSQYEGICKHAKEEVKSTFAARDRELARRRQLDRVRERSPRNRQQIASADVSRTVKALEEQIDIFEKKKLHDLKSVLLDFVTVELSFHAKAIELYTRAHQEIAEIDEDGDMEEFRSALRVPESISRLDTVKRTSFRNSSFSLASIFATPQTFRRSSDGIPHSPVKVSKSLSVESLKRSTGFEDSRESVHVEDFLDESSSLVSEEDRSQVMCFHNLSLKQWVWKGVKTQPHEDK
uniref:Uncharacterized protein n=1 Tax=Timema shepardi TaxID=629360 RepID=A0A7R9AZ12_TIMSH|nr:unnamed protein product [Timema shepardi]